ncbi:MAG: hypothetical protein GTN78_21920, partial [Gemmatimonadales bacterium]|nr:hypothetical protein [Gemmatimonadales bacterium]
MRRKPTVYLICSVFVVFAAWEAINHMWLMDLPMATYHMVSLTVEVSLALVIVLAALRTVTRQAQAEQQQHALRDAVVTILARELRPPLVSLLAELNALESSAASDLGDHTRDLLKQASARGGVLLGMIEGLVAMAGGAEGPAGCAGLSPGELVEQTADAYRPVAGQAGVTLTAKTSENLPSACLAADRMLSVLSILVNNALRVTPRGGQVEVGAAEDEGRAATVFSVSDGGPPLLDRPADIGDLPAGTSDAELRSCSMLAEALGGSARYLPGPSG